MSESLENKVQRLLDIEDIKVLKLRYARHCDNNYNPDGIAACFTEAGIWNGGALGYAETRDGIRDFFANAPNLVEFAIHYTTNPIIEVNGNRAKGQWYLWQPMVMKEGNQAMWLGAHYDEVYQRVGDQWLIHHLELDIKTFSPYEAGFANTRVADANV
jgi:hypothetical protein